MNSLWNNRLAAALIVLLAGLGLCSPMATGCAGAALYCPTQRLSAAPLGRLASEAVPAPLKFLFVLVLAAVGSQLVTSDNAKAVATRIAQYRRYVEPHLPPAKPWRDKPPLHLFPLGVA